LVACCLALSIVIIAVELTPSVSLMLVKKDKLSRCVRADVNFGQLLV
jgi:hypothetical protein